jgi:phosphoserine/homoserine phosphotransferase
LERLLDILCLDLEGVLVPEVWQAVAKSTAIDELNKTTRDIPDYDDLMSYRLEIVDRNNISLEQIQLEISKLEPLEGALEFLDWARSEFQVFIVSDTFYDFARPLMVQLGCPSLFCHQLVIENGRIAGYELRQQDPKRKTVEALQSLNYRVIAAGDSFNDLSMLKAADVGFFYRAPSNVLELHPEFSVANNYDELKKLICSG